MTELCKGCGLTIVPLVDARYTGREPEEHWHFQCWSKDRPPPTNMRTLAAEMATASANVQRAFDNLRDGLARSGAGMRPGKPKKNFVLHEDDE